MISFSYQQPNTKCKINESSVRSWIKSVIKSEGGVVGDIQYVFCNDNDLIKINKKFLNHDTLTDIITFPTTNHSKIISGDIFISTERVKENSGENGLKYDHEIKRVIIHGILHLTGYNDHSIADKNLMRSKEDYYLHLQS